MDKIIYLYIVSILAGFFTEVKAETEIKNIVFIFGANETLPAYKSILQGFNTQLNEEYGIRYNVFIEYLDLERFPNEGYLRELVDLYNKKFEHIPIDLIIAVAPGAYDFLLQNGLKALHFTPTITLEIIGADPARYPQDDQVTEVRIPYTPKRTMENAFALFPEYKKVLIIGGCSNSDLAFVKRISMDTSYFSDTHDFTVLTCIPFDSALQVLSQLPKDNIVFCPSFIADLDGSPLSTSYAVRQFSSLSKAPLFTMSDNCIVDGGVGGDIISFEDAGKKCGSLASAVLKKGMAKGLTVIEGAFYRPMYDWQELKKWGLLNSSAIPRASSFYKEEKSFFSLYRRQVLALIFVFAVQVLLISYLIQLIRNRRKVAAQKAENERLYRYLVREERLNLMAQLTASLSHELNQPLTAILFNAQAGLKLLASGRLANQQTEEILSDIVEDDKRAAGIIASVRNMMKPGTKGKGIIDLGSIISETLKVLHSEMGKAKVVVNFSIPDQSLLLLADKIQLQQVMLNILLNAKTAMKDTPDNQKKINIHITGTASMVTVQIQDKGPGIPDTMLPQIFNSFFTTKEGNMGMGLSICKTIITNHGGKIWVENLTNGGAQFSFTLRRNNPHE